MQNRGSVVLVALLGVVAGFSTGMLSIGIGIKLVILAIVFALQAASCMSILRSQRSPASPVNTPSYPIDPPVESPSYPFDPPVIPPVAPGYERGTVKWYNPVKGYGFIAPDSGARDLFVHVSAVERAGLSTLNEGQRIEFQLVTNRGKQSAENLRLL